jgi:hypothetical protein
MGRTAACDAVTGVDSQLPTALAKKFHHSGYTALPVWSSRTFMYKSITTTNPATSGPRCRQF